MSKLFPLCMLLLPSIGFAQNVFDYSWVQNPSNGHFYAQDLWETDWHAHSATATSFGGYLACLESSAENDWVRSQFSWPNDQRKWCLGLEDIDLDGSWEWVSGQPLTWTNWLEVWQGDQTCGVTWSEHMWYSARINNGPALFELEFDPYLDSDIDGLPDLMEQLLGTDVLDQDTDDDGLSDGEETAPPDQGLTWFFNSQTDHFYALVFDKSLYEAEAIANSYGGHVVTVNDLAESTWIGSTFSSFIGGGPHIVLGYYQDRDDPNYSEPDGGWKWISGESPAFTAWQPGEPNNLGGNQDRANMVVAQGLESWDDGGVPSDTGTYALEAPFNSIAPVTDPLAWDTDGDGLSDGLEMGLDSIYWDGHGIPGVSGTDPGVFVPDSDPLTTTDPLDIDSDEDGLADGDEDLDGDGAVSAGETDALQADSDGDLLPDGLELGLTVGTPDTDPNIFAPDADPLTTTDPLLADTDGGGQNDGDEDFDHDGAFNYVEFDPNNPADDRFDLQVGSLIPGQQALFTLTDHRAGSTVAVVYSLSGLGSTSTPFGFEMELAAPLTAFPSQVVFTSSSTQLVDVPISAPIGLDVWLQAVERLFVGDFFRMTQVVHAQIQ